MLNDRGDIVAGWLVQVTAVLAIIAVLLFEVVSIGLARVGAADDASNAAQVASETYLTTRDVDRAYRAAVAYASEHSSSVPVDQFTVYPDGTVEMAIDRTARSLVIKHIGPIRKWTEVRERARVRSLPG